MSTRNETFIQDGAETIPFITPINTPMPGQPRPKQTLYDYFPEAEPTGTAISRTWYGGDAERCTLCAVCARTGDHCLVLVHNRVVKPGDCPMYRQARTGEAVRARSS